ncbi:hypothetical protein BLD44_016645 [Mastigocladus laminosus UU774]|nr:hypothetical protein BLD44_016645 [Mastigocladus laminosus UU774]
MQPHATGEKFLGKGTKLFFAGGGVRWRDRKRVTRRTKQKETPTFKAVTTTYQYIKLYQQVLCRTEC